MGGLSRFDVCRGCCLTCGNCDGDPPGELTANFSGLVSLSPNPPWPDCECEDICAVDYVCQWVSPCVWRYYFTDAACDLDYVEINLNLAAELTTRLRWGGNNYIEYKQTGMDDPLDCDAIDETINQSGGYFDYAHCTPASVSSSSVRVTS